MNYCNSYRLLENQSVITMVIIPPTVVERLELYVMQSVFNFNGKIMRVGLGADESMLFEVIFQDNTKRQMFCEEVNREIEECLPFKMSSSMEKDGKEALNVKLDLREALERFREIMEEIRPAIQFIEENGGWLDKKTGEFPGMDALKKALKEERMSDEMMKAIIALGNFMAINIIGKQVLNTEEAELCCGDNTIVKQ